MGCVPSDGGDKDARDSVQMRLERRLREGQEDGSVIGRQVGTFERHTKVKAWLTTMSFPLPPLLVLQGTCPLSLLLSFPSLHSFLSLHPLHPLRQGLTWSPA